MHGQRTDRGNRMDGKKNAKLTIRLPKDLLDAAHRKAERTDVPISQIVRHCLRRWVDEESPDKDKESNWLPAPKEPFYMLFRMYQPDIEVLNGQYELPGVKRTK